MLAPAISSAVTASGWSNLAAYISGVKPHVVARSTRGLNGERKKTDSLNSSAAICHLIVKNDDRFSTYLFSSSTVKDDTKGNDGRWKVGSSGC